MTEILFKTKQGKVIIIDDKGNKRAVEPPPFEHEQIVKTSPKHYSQKSFIMVLKPSWTKTRGWVYGERYISRDGSSGGTGWWNNADMYELLPDPIDILIAKKLKLEEKKCNSEKAIKNFNSELRHINYALKIINPID
jgi:hypothetical protein